MYFPDRLLCVWVSTALLCSSVPSLAEGTPEVTPTAAKRWREPGDIPQPSGNWQVPGEIKQPTGPWQVPGEIQVPKGIRAIKREGTKCESRISVLGDALFEFDKSTFTPDSEETLKALQSTIEALSGHEFRIEGHTDSKGSDQYNEKLSQARAEAVRDWLLSRRLISARTPIEAHGEKHPVAPNENPDGSDNPAGRQKNRRVELVAKICESDNEKN
jgi:outer membrane protein OmpA-like peptidoglycan-associated protein